MLLSDAAGSVTGHADSGAASGAVGGIIWGLFRAKEVNLQHRRDLLRSASDPRDTLLLDENSLLYARL